jgi:predicted MPP superfamily phosphohydrolase
LGLLLYAWWIEPDWIEVKEHDRKHAQVQEPIRVAQLSDLHLNEIGHREHRIAQALERIKPHIVLLSGDVIDQVDALPVLDALLGSWVILVPPVLKDYIINVMDSVCA